MGKQGNIANYVGLALAGIGFLVIGLAWNGAAGLNHVPGQFPYLISGGLTGLGLILVGVVMLVIQTMRHDGARRVRQMADLADAVAELQAQLAPGAIEDPALTGEFAPRPRRAAGEALTEQIQVVPARGRRS
jgi:hypothetical protein